jgi:drug/metabolite transporter (DMT)-like permease
VSDLSTSPGPAAPASDGPAAEAPPRGEAFGGWAALLVVYVVWGSTYLAIRVGVETIPPLLLAGARYLIAGLILFPFAIRSGPAATRAADRPRRATWLTCAVVGILLLLGGNGLVSVGERTVPSGFASLLVATVPLWLLVMDAVLRRRWIGWLPLAGLIIGLAGVALLAGLGDGVSASGASAAGVLIILVASVSWALGTIASMRLVMPQRAPLATAMQMLTGGVTILVLAAATGEFGSFDLTQVSLRSWLAMAFLIGPGSILALSAYNVAVRRLPTSTVATYPYVNPVVAVILGATLLNERLTPTMLIGGGLIIVAVALVVWRRGSPSH